MIDEYVHEPYCNVVHDEPQCPGRPVTPAEGYAATMDFIQQCVADIQRGLNDGQDAVDIADRLATAYTQNVDPRGLPGFLAVALVMLAQEANRG